MTPSLPTFFIASAMILPMVSSFFSGNGGHLGNHFAENLLRDLVERARGAVAFVVNRAANRGHGLLDAALQRHRVGTGSNGLHAFAVDGLRQNGRGGGAVASDVRGLRRN